MKVKLMDSDNWIDTKKIIAFIIKDNEELNLKTKKIEYRQEYQILVPGKTLLVSKANWAALHDIWRNEQ